MTDLSGTAFSTVDGAGCAQEFISYLDLASDCFHSVKAFAHSLLQVGPGHHVLDFGCGCGSDVREMAALVAPGGVAVGVDNSTLLIREAQRRHAQCGLALEFETGNAGHLAWPDGHFHACYVDRVLQHLDDPQRALIDIYRVLKPGGRIVAVDRDWGLVTLNASDATTTSAVLNRARAGIRNGRIGGQLFAMLENAGFTAIRVYPHKIEITNFATADALLDLRTVLDHAITERLVEQDAADSWLAELVNRDAAGTFCASVWLFVGYGKKTR